MRVRCTLTWLVLLATGAGAQETADLKPVVVTGSLVPRIDAESALPLQVIRRQEIERSGAQTVEELLDRVTANFGGQHEAQGIGDAGMPGFAGASLRGLGPAQTLVLLNGRRLANYAFTAATQGIDLHAIPLAAIDRVEILKDGASALYGSDAIAGVINFITRQDFAGVDASASLSVPKGGRGKQTRVTLTAGQGDAKTDGFNVFAVLDVENKKRLRAADRSFAASGFHPELGLENLSPAAFPANILVPARFPFVNPAAPACTDLTVSLSTACLFDAQRTIDLTPASQQLSLLARGTFKIAAEADAYAEISASSDRLQFRTAPTPAISFFTLSDTAFVLPASSPYYPQGLGFTGDLDLAYRTLPLGGRTSETHSTNVRVLVGAKTRRGAWDLDVALALNDSRSTERYLSGFVDAGRLSDALATGLVNPFGPSAPEGDALLASTQIAGASRKAQGRTETADLRASRELLQLPHGPLQLATGVETRHESLRDAQSAIVADVIGVVPAAPKEGSRNAQAAYVELVAPVLKELEIQTAARLDRYSDFGTALSPKVALRFQPSPSWLARGSVGRGFRAPSLPELYTQQSTTRVENLLVNGGWSDPIRCPVTGLPSDCMPDVVAISGGNPALRPQRSTQLSAGLVFERPASWFASVDFWSIRIRDTIGSLQFEQVVADPAAFEGKNVVRGPVDPAFPNLPGPIVRIVTLDENLGDQRVSGTDVSLQLRPRATPLGRVSARLDGTYVFHARQQLVAGQPLDLIGRAVPRWNHLLTADLARGPWTTSLSQRYRHGYPDEKPLPDGTTRRVASYLVWDGQLAMELSRAAKVWLGVRNLFDRTPPFTNTGFNFQGGYDPVYADPLGRTWTVGVRVGWP